MTALFRDTDPETFKNAGRTCDRTYISRTVAAVLDAHPNGLTDHELWEATGLDWTLKGSVVKRRSELDVVDTGERRPSPSGRPCVVWTLRRYAR